MIEILITLLFIHYIGLFIFKPKHNTLGCGIFAWAGKNPKVFNKDKYNILGIYNDSRGGHSCGISIDGEIFNGVEKHKKFIDWLAAFSYDSPKKVPVVIGHTRYATGGEHNIANAHPFGFGDNEQLDGYSFIGVHNGSLLNHKEFIKNYDVEDSERFVKDEKFPNVTTFRFKIDSELLLESIYKSGNFKVLSEYNGAAALVFTNTHEPNVMYCYHGASKMEKWDSGEKIFEERPLYYYKKGKNDLYVSSIPESLQVIGAEYEKTLFEFDHNVIYRITDGDIDNAEKLRVSRKECHQKGTVTYFPRQNTPNPQVSMGFRERRSKKEERREERRKKKEEINNIGDERIDPALYGTKVYMERLRYKRNGHNINGVYTWIPSYGFLWMSDTVKDANSKFWLNMGKLFNPETGKFIDQYEGSNLEIEKQFVAISNDVVNPSLMYFYKGIMLQTELDYKVCMQLKGTKDDPGFIQLSYMAKHPIYDDVIGTKDKQRIIKDDKLFTGNIQPLQSGKIYNIREGNLESITPLDIPKAEDVVIPLSAGINLNKVEESSDDIDDDKVEDVVYDEVTEQKDNFLELIKDEEKNITSAGTEIIKEEDDIDNFLLDEKLDKVFTPILMNIQAGKRDIQKFLPAPKAASAVETIDFFVEAVEELVIKEEK